MYLYGARSLIERSTGRQLLEFEQAHFDQMLSAFLVAQR